MMDRDSKADTESGTASTSRRFDAIRERTKNLTAGVKSKTAEAIEAGKVEMKLRQERAAIVTRENELGQIAANCGATALGADISLGNAGFETQRQQATSAHQKMMESQLNRDTAAKELLSVDPKTNPTRVHELKAQIKTLDAEVRQESGRFDASKKELGKSILLANLTDPRFADFYQQQQEIRKRIEEHSTNVARLEQDQAIHKKSLGFDVKKVVAGLAVVILAIAGIFVFASGGGKGKSAKDGLGSGQFHSSAAPAVDARADFVKTSSQMGQIDSVLAARAIQMVEQQNIQKTVGWQAIDEMMDQASPETQTAYRTWRSSVISATK
jgi:hypothetical protein